MGQILLSNYISLNLGPSYIERSCFVLSMGQFDGLKSHQRREGCAGTDTLRNCHLTRFKRLLSGDFYVLESRAAEDE